MFCLTRKKYNFDAWNQLDDQETFYYTGKNRIVDGICRPGFSKSSADALLFDTEVEAMKKAKAIESILGFYIQNSEYFVVERIEKESGFSFHNTSAA